MVPSARQLCAARFHRGLESGVALLLVGDAAQAPLGVRVGKVGPTVVAHALRELAHLLDKGRVAEVFMLAAWGQVAARLLRGTKRRIVRGVLALRKSPVGIWVGEVGHPVVPNAPRERKRP